MKKYKCVAVKHPKNGECNLSGYNRSHEVESPDGRLNTGCYGCRYLRLKEGEVNKND